MPFPSPEELPNPGIEPWSPKLSEKHNHCVHQNHLGGFPGGSEGSESVCMARDIGLILGSGRSPGEGNGSPLQYFLENSVDRGAGRAAVHGVAKSQT